MVIIHACWVSHESLHLTVSDNPSESAGDRNLHVKAKQDALKGD